MIDKNAILQSIKNSVMATDPDATVILYGSYARGDYNEDSDIDLLILIDKDKVTWEDRKRISYPLYDIQFQKGILISPMLLTKKYWTVDRVVTPFYENVNSEGVIL